MWVFYEQVKWRHMAAKQLRGILLVMTELDELLLVFANKE